MAVSFGVQEVLYQLEGLGLFEIILPFLLIFSVIYGVLSYMNIFGKDNKGIHAVIAIVIGLLAVRLPFFSLFLAEISPRLGVGLTVLLALLILIGLFTPDTHRGTLSWVLLGIGAIIFIIVLAQTGTVLSYFGYGGGFYSEQIIGWMVMIGILIGVIVAVTAGGGSRDDAHRSKGPAGMWVPQK